ncbi:MAG: hypothetical protein AAF982_11105, partial [Pseudomonadota bacterium]
GQGRKRVVMAGASKILTVSYGTFSCTLEGFDDPFTMMRAIAEYFRDLAADDRYFGAEPPQPDVAMLHRIAETAAQTRVEARIAKTGIKLTQADDAGRMAPPADDLEDGGGEPLATAAQALDDRGITAPETVPFPKDSMAETVAQKLARIRAAATHDADPYTEDEHADAFFGKSTAMESEPFADMPEEMPGEVPKDATRRSAATRADRSLFDPVAQARPGERDSSTRDASNAPEETVRTLQDAMAPAGDGRVERLSETEVPMKERVPAGQKVEEPSESAGLSADDRVRAADPTENHVIEEERAGTPGVVHPDRIRVVRVKRKSADPVPVSPARFSVEDRLGDVAAGGGDPASRASPPATEEVELAVGLAEIDVEAASMRDGRARLAAANTGDDALDRIMATTNDRLGDLNAKRRHSTLSHLKAAVTATRAEPSIAAAGDKDPDAAAAYREDLDQVVSKAGDKRQAPLILVSEQRVDADGRTLQALRRQTASWPEPAPASGPSEKTDAAMAAAGHVGGFADYAENLGAVDLQDLLEAAAVYTAQVEGRPHFSRPMIMGHVHSAMNQNFSKEDSLRSFGILLRNGKIKKVRRGRFAVSEDSKFLPEEARVVHR